MVNEVIESERVFVEIVTAEDAISYIREKVVELRRERALCDVRPPGDEQVAAAEQRRRYDRWRIRFGLTIGALEALMHCRKIPQPAYEMLRLEVVSTAVPTVISIPGN